MGHTTEFPVSNEVQNSRMFLVHPEIAEGSERVKWVELSTNSAAVHVDCRHGTSQWIPAWTRLSHPSTS